MLFNRMIGGLLPQMNRDPINVNPEDLHCKVLEVHQRKNDKSKDTQNGLPIFLTGATEIVQGEDRRPWTHSVIVEPNNSDQRDTPIPYM